MSTATETCACGASITVDARDVLALGWRLSDWRREHHHDLDAADACRERDEARADRDEWRENAVTLRGLLDNHAHNDTAMEQALRDVTAERDEARASVLAARKEVEAARAEVEKARAEIKATNGALARGRASAAAVARVLNLCNEKPECAHGLDCHCDCLAVADVRAAADTNRPIDEEEDTP